MRITEFLEELSRELPLNLAMPDDPVGVQVMVEDKELSTIAVAYEVNEQMVRHADEAGAELVIAFHPLIYPALKHVTGATRVERTVVELIDKRIALYIVHTAFDAHPDGTSALLARRLGLMNIRPIVPDPRHERAGMGAIGELPEPTGLEALARSLRTACGADAVRVSIPAGGVARHEIRTVAILGGSGMSFYERAAGCGADAFITADVRYHAFHAANDSIPVLDPGHAESEALVTDGMAVLVKRVVAGIGAPLHVVPLAEPTNPVRLII